MSKGVPENLALLFGSAVLLGDTLGRAFQALR
jgi:hypothetical protein